jgi:hypothetical protein
MIGQDPKEEIRMALIASSVLAINLEKDGHSLEQFLGVTLQPEQKKHLERSADDILREHENATLTTGIIQAIQDKLETALHEARWKKYTLLVLQSVGMVAAGLLLRDYNQLPVGAAWLLALYVVSVFGGIIWALVKLR